MGREKGEGGKVRRRKEGVEGGVEGGGWREGWRGGGVEGGGGGGGLGKLGDEAGEHGE